MGDGGAPVDFVVIGAMKSGTTWVDEVLRRSTTAELPVATKETFFFDRYWERGLAWYDDQFDSDVAGGQRGEVASTYYASPPARERLAEVAPDARIVVVVREPGARTWSHLTHLIRKGAVAPGTRLQEACQEHPELLTMSRYHDLLAPWRDAWGDRFHLLAFEDLATDPVAFAQRVWHAAGVHGDAAALPIGSVNAARTPRSHLLSRLAARTSEALHHRGLHHVVTVAKSVGVDRLVERSGRNDDGREEGQAWARAAVDTDTTAFLGWADGIDPAAWGRSAVR